MKERSIHVQRQYSRKYNGNGNVCCIPACLEAAWRQLAKLEGPRGPHGDICYWATVELSALFVCSCKAIKYTFLICL